MEDKIRRLKAI